MKPVNVLLHMAAVAIISTVFFACSKNNQSTNSGSDLFPLATGDAWNYKLKIYDTANATVTDSSLFTLSIAKTFSSNGSTYYRFQNSPDTTVLSVLSPLSNSSLGSIDYEYGTDFYTFFISGPGDSTSPVNSWPIEVSANGSTCQGTDKLFAHYADTTLENLDGTVYTHSIKNIIETYNCSGKKMIANIYFIKEGVGLVRYSKYIYNASGLPKLQLAWVLESETLH
ncbi:MAG TPA: hypothetical protein VG847_09390 [Chitinophagaceae bacterium]|nr:hypothetical protein [Chitinophagaceae bacterium]